MIPDFIAALRHMEEPIIAVGKPEIELFTRRTMTESQIAVHINDVNIYLLLNKSKSKLVESNIGYIFLDYDIMSESKKAEALEIEDLCKQTLELTKQVETKAKELSKC